MLMSAALDRLGSLLRRLRAGAGGLRRLTSFTAPRGLGLTVALTTTMGCVVTTVAPAPRGVVVSGPPPAPIVEVRSRAPAWIPGHWEAPPVGAVWESPHYVPANGVYVYQPGGWRRGPLPTPPAASPPPSADALR
jgi:hypothetical protein